jgi:hypothetical protein
MQAAHCGLAISHVALQMQQDYLALRKRECFLLEQF